MAPNGLNPRAAEAQKRRPKSRSTFRFLCLLSVMFGVLWLPQINSSGGLLNLHWDTGVSMRTTFELVQPTKEILTDAFDGMVDSKNSHNFLRKYYRQYMHNLNYFIVGTLSSFGLNFEMTLYLYHILSALVIASALSMFIYVLSLQTPLEGIDFTAWLVILALVSGPLMMSIARQVLSETIALWFLLVGFALTDKALRVDSIKAGMLYSALGGLSAFLCIKANYLFGFPIAACWGIAYLRAWHDARQGRLPLKRLGAVISSALLAFCFVLIVEIYRYGGPLLPWNFVNYAAAVAKHYPERMSDIAHLYNFAFLNFGTLSICIVLMLHRNVGHPWERWAFIVIFIAAMALCFSMIWSESAIQDRHPFPFLVTLPVLGIWYILRNPRIIPNPAVLRVVAMLFLAVNLTGVFWGAKHAVAAGNSVRRTVEQNVSAGRFHLAGVDWLRTYYVEHDKPRFSPCVDVQNYLEKRYDDRFIIFVQVFRLTRSCGILRFFTTGQVVDWRSMARYDREGYFFFMDTAGLTDRPVFVLTPLGRARKLVRTSGGRLVTEQEFPKARVALLRLHGPKEN